MWALAPAEVLDPEQNLMKGSLENSLTAKKQRVPIRHPLHAATSVSGLDRLQLVEHLLSDPVQLDLEINDLLQRVVRRIRGHLTAVDDQHWHLSDTQIVGQLD